MNENLQIKACGSLARDVPRRNLRSFSLVSGEKAYNRSDDYSADGSSSANIPIHVTTVRGSQSLTMLSVSMGYRDESDTTLENLQMHKLLQLIVYRGSDDRNGIERLTLGW